MGNDMVNGHEFLIRAPRSLGWVRVIEESLRWDRLRPRRHPTPHSRGVYAGHMFTIYLWHSSRSSPGIEHGQILCLVVGWTRHDDPSHE